MTAWLQTESLPLPRLSPGGRSKGWDEKKRSPTNYGNINKSTLPLKNEIPGEGWKVAAMYNQAKSSRYYRAAPLSLTQYASRQ